MFEISETKTYKMSMSLGVLKQLGIRLYSTIPPVLSEAVANAWDADAENVDIEISKEEITIEDDGHGMSVEEANEKYPSWSDMKGVRKKRKPGQNGTEK
jgi:DNA gyrase/topoisomerase IV subunit B